MRTRVIRALLLAPLLSSALVDQVAAQLMDPPVVIANYERAREQRDVDGALAHFADDAVVRIVERETVVFSGKPEIRRFLQRFLGMPTLLASKRQVVGNIISWSEHNQGQLPVASDLTVEAVVFGGKIQSLAYRVAAPPAAEAPAATGPTRLPAAIALAGLLSLGVALLAVASLAPRREASPSSLRGKLVRGLGAFHANG